MEREIQKSDRREGKFYHWQLSNTKHFPALRKTEIKRKFYINGIITICFAFAIIAIKISVDFSWWRQFAFIDYRTFYERKFKNKHFLEIFVHDVTYRSQSLEYHRCKLLKYENWSSIPQLQLCDWFVTILLVCKS